MQRRARHRGVGERLLDTHHPVPHVGEHGSVVFSRKLVDAKDLFAGCSRVVVHRNADAERAL